jgi:histidinol dehydrogenase
MPTGGTARFSSPLNLDDFVKKLSVISVREDQQAFLVPHAVRLAKAEGLTGHARSAAGRLKD